MTEFMSTGYRQMRLVSAFEIVNHTLSMGLTAGMDAYVSKPLRVDELFATLVPGSTEVYRVDSYVASYDATTSDHFPVLSRYTWGSGGGTPGSVTLTTCPPTSRSG